MKKPLCDLPALRRNMRCSCGAPLCGEMCCIVSGARPAACRANWRNGEQDPQKRESVLCVQWNVKYARANEFHEMRRANT